MLSDLPQGPEPESLDYGIINDKTVIFVGVERPGMIAIYSLVPGTDLDLQFESIHYNGGRGDTWYKLWAERQARDLEPEDVRFKTINFVFKVISDSGFCVCLRYYFKPT